MADTPIAMEKLVERFGGYVCSKFSSYQKIENLSLFIVDNEYGTGTTTTGKKTSKKAAAYTTAYACYGFNAYDAPNVIICSRAEAEASTS